MVAIALLVGLLGLAIGSFLNVVAHRVPEGRSVVSPPSACPSCETPIAPRDNIPVVSWLVLRGRCRHCGEPISPRYMVVEVATALLFAATTLVVGVDWTLPAHLWFVGLTVVLIVTDFEHFRLPNRILLPGTVVGVVLLALGALLEGRIGDLPEALAAGAGYFILLLIVAIVARGGFGFGDVKLAFILGVFTGFGGWGLTALAAFGGFFIGGTTSLLLILTRIRSRKDYIPFGPPMMVAAWIAIAWGREIIDWYLG